MDIELQSRGERETEGGQGGMREEASRFKSGGCESRGEPTDI